MGAVRTAGSFVLAAVMLAAQSSGPISDVPSLGDPFPCVPTTMLVIRSAQMSPSCLVIRNRIPFEVAGDFAWGRPVPPDARVVYVAVKDPAYRTTEGIRVGSSLAEVLRSGAAAPQAERGWAFHTQLKSGWRAAFLSGIELTRKPLPPDSRVAWLFRR
jgi:hypothetical protein